MWVGVEPGFAEALTMAALVDGDDSVAFMVKAASVDEGVVASVVQSRQVSVEEVCEGGGEFIRMLLFICVGAADEFRSRRDAPFV